MENEKYFIGLDVGTDSVGYAVTREDYSIIKHKGEPMWGTTVFDSASQCAERRGYRTARRRLNRRQQRVALIGELFAKEISKIDKDFFIRIKESSLFKEDKTTAGEYDFLRDELFDGEPYNKKYPTIHHLIYDLMKSKDAHDVRLIYIACAWLVAHRGHFLSEVEKNNIDNLLLFEPVYESFMNHFSGERIKPWQCSADLFADVLKKKVRITEKENLFIELLFNGKKPKNEINEEMPYSIMAMIKLLSGGSVKVADLYANENYKELKSISLGADEETFAEILSKLDDAEILIKLKAMYDWAVLENVLDGKSCISESKIMIYEQHKKDLAGLKKFVKKYCKEKYNEIFREVSGELKNYPAYSKHFDNKSERSSQKGARKEEFCEYLLKALKDIDCMPEDEEFYNDMLERLRINKFLPKQVDGDNRVIPYQLYWYELKEILASAENYLPFLKEKDADNITVSEKIISVFEFRIPYYVGPLTDSSQSKYAWMKRKADGKIYPWNIEKKVDFDESEQTFIRRMTNTCSYLPGEYVLPKNSLLYSKYEVLNEINNIKIDSAAVSVEQKQLIYNELFAKNARVTMKKLKDFMCANGICHKDSLISGIDVEGGIKSSLKSHLDFKNLIANTEFSEADAEDYINHCAYSEDKIRLRRWVKNRYEFLDEKNQTYISNLKYKNFGRLSRKLLEGINGVFKETGEIGTVMDFLWNTNDNLSQIILSDKYTFSDEIDKLRKEYYGASGSSLESVLDEMYVSNAVKRPIMRALDIICDIKSAMKSAPEKIFIEMARGPEEKNKRTKSRKEQILELYKTIKSSDVKMLSAQLDSLGDNADNKLQSDVLFLYFMQLGRCMYSGEIINIEMLKSSVYNIDHIYPRCHVKDDSVLNNKVLVLSEYNEKKKDVYPIPGEWRANMRSFWETLHKNGLMNDEKFKRLIRSSPFTNEEKMGFINRQIVETRQSTKALARILNNKFPQTKIVYVKAGLVAEFRKKYDLLKCRSINDLHHAKDAYLNIVVGNVYNERFTQKWFSVDNTYSLNYDVIFGKPYTSGGKEIWKGEKSIAETVKTVRKNNAHYTRFPFCRKGGFFDQQPVKAASGLVPLKAGLPTEKYGGYKKTTASFFSLVKYKIKNKPEVIIMPVELLYSERFLSDAEFAKEYAAKTIESIINKKPEDISFPLGKRILKINTLFSADGFEMCLGGKSSGGSDLIFISASALKLDYKYEKYIKSLERFAEKKKENKKIVCVPEYDGITPEKNTELYDILLNKYSSRPFVLMKANQADVLRKGRERFCAADIEDQITLLVNFVNLMKTGRTGTVDLSVADGSPNVGKLRVRSLLSNWKKSYSDVRIIDTSASGINKKISMNLLELL